MNSSKNSTGSWPVSIGASTARGFWLVLGAGKAFVSFKAFPWFRAFTPSELANVRRPWADHIRWPAFDIDLHLDAIVHPERYPLIEKRLRGDPEEVVARLRRKKRTA
jgi:hypothetical protein